VCQWPVGRTELLAKTEELLAPGVWEGLAVELPGGYLGPLWVAVEDDFGLGAAVAAAARVPDGRIEAAGWAYTDWDSAVASVERLAGAHRIMGLQVGASLLSRVPQGMWAKPAGGREVRTGLPLLRDLAAGAMVVHDVASVDLDEALRAARDRESPSGLSLIVGDGSHLVRALVW